MTGDSLERPSSLKKDWVLTQDAFARLLARLDPDQELAGQKYETIRHGLITFFECRGGRSPEDLADETINRVARRLMEGKELYASTPSAYFYGVARNVLREHWDAPDAASAPLERARLEDLSHDPAHAQEQHLRRRREDQQLECLERCLQGLASTDRDLISSYYHGETTVKIQNRKLLAERLGITVNALKIRALRIREKLEACVEQCLPALPRSETPFADRH